MFKKALIIIATFLTVATVNAQVYHEECKEDLREFMRQGISWMGDNYQRLGLTVDDTLTWYENENWIPKVIGLTWVETESKLRIKTVDWHNLHNTNLPAFTLHGDLKLSSPVLTHFVVSSNRLTGLDVSKNVELVYLDFGFSFYNPVEKGIDLTKNVKLEYLNCYRNYLRTLDLSKNIELIYLNCSQNNLIELNISNCNKLEYLACNSNHRLEILDISNKPELTFLNCSYAGLNDLNVSNNLKLEYLNCAYNNLTELNLSENIELTFLNCFINNLTELDLSKNPKLDTLICFRNKLVELDLSNNQKLEFLECYENNLKFSTLPLLNFNYRYNPQNTINGGTKKYTDTIDLSSEYSINGNLTSYSWFDITIGTEREITPPTNTNGVFTFTVQHAGKKLRCRMTNAQFPQLTLIYEVNIEKLFTQFYYHPDCKEDLREIMRQVNNFERLGLTVADTLTWYENEYWIEKIKGISWTEFEGMLRIDAVFWTGSGKPMQMVHSLIGGKLKFSSPVLEYLDCYLNFLTELDVSKNINLKYLNCYYNNLTQLDIRNNLKLERFICAYNGLTVLDVNNNTQLKHLDCSSNKLTSLDLSNNLDLRFLSCNSNSITELDLSKNVDLTFLWASHNKLTELNVTQNIKLDTLALGGYQGEYDNISEIDLSKNVELRFLGCWDINLMKLDVSNNPKLEYLDCNYNNLTELDLSKNIKLKDLICCANKLTKLDLTNNTELTHLNCYGNDLTELKLGNLELRWLQCEGNRLKFSHLPIIRPTVLFSYNPQGSTYGGTISYMDTLDLSSEYNMNGHITNFVWEGSSTPPLTNGNGIFTFTEEHINKRLVCKMTNAYFPGDYRGLTVVFEIDIKTVNINEPPEIHFTVSPNPAQTQLTIQHSKEIENILLYDLSGRLLRTYSGITVIDISDLDSGVYFLTVDGNAVKFVRE